MIGKPTGGSRPAAVAEVHDILAKEKEVRELGFEQQATLDYSKKVKKLKAKDAVELVGKLEKVEKITPEMAVKIADLLPATKEQLTIIVSKERYTLNEKEVKDVLDLTMKYREKMELILEVPAEEKAAEDAGAGEKSGEKKE